MKHPNVAAAIAALLVLSAPLRCLAQSSPQPQAFAGLTLAAAESAALARSPDVAIARAKVREARALFDAARASFGPALTGNYTEAPQGGSASQTIAQRLTTIGAQWTLGDLLAYSPAVGQANAVLRAAQLDFENVERTQAIAEIGTYYAALEARSELRARREEVASAKAQQRAAQLRFSAGDAPRLDVVRASVALASAYADLARAQAASADADAALEQTTGVAHDDLETTSDAPASPQTQGVGMSALARALSTRPDIAAARQNVSAQERAVAVARRGGWPLVTLAAGYTRGVDTGVEVAGPSASAQMTLPLGGAAHDRVLAEEARLAQARAQLVKLQRAVTLEVGSSLRAYRAQTAALRATDRALHDALAEFDATQIGYRSGAVSSLDVEAARTTYIDALVARISALYARLQAGATLQLVIGGLHA